MRTEGRTPQPPHALRDEARHWLVRLTAGDMSVQEQARFQRWLDASPSHKEAFAYEQATWRQVESLKHLMGPTTWAVPDPDDVSLAGEPGRRMRARRRVVFAGLALAASLLAALFAGDAWLALISDYRTASGEQIRVSLPDGSTAYLNTATAIGVDYTPRERRIELLNGEAYFVVARNAEAPFSVRSQGRLTRAVGTAFAVHDANGKVSVTVSEGKIEVVPAGAAAKGPGGRPQTPAVQVSADHQVIYARGGAIAPVRAVDAKAALAWRTGKIIMDELPFDDAIAELDRYFPGRIVVISTAALDIPVSGVFSARSLDSAIGTLAAMQGLRVRSVTPYLVILY